ncbi:hypothetical protein ACI3PL_24660, partial [Lacticaseibacillus paracasei]
MPPARQLDLGCYPVPLRKLGKNGPADNRRVARQVHTRVTGCDVRMDELAQVVRQALGVVFGPLR